MVRKGQVNDLYSNFNEFKYINQLF